MSRRTSCLVALTLLVAHTARANPPGLTPVTAESPYHAAPPIPGDLPAPLSAPPAVNKEIPQVRSTDADGDTTIDRAGFATIIHSDGTVTFDDHALSGGLLVSPMTGVAAVLNFDVTDVLMRALGQDPYLTQKLDLLDSTRDERAARRVRNDAVVMDHALRELPAYLGAIWRYQGWSAATRRQVLFALWDEAAERGDELLRHGGAEARQRIERFIAVHLPPGSRDAFSDDELVALNRLRTSAHAFAPYGSATPEPGDHPDAAPDAEIELAAATPEAAVTPALLRAF